MIKNLLFDVDGVLVDTDELHFQALNAALKVVHGFEITRQQHECFFKGLPTKKKLAIMNVIYDIDQREVARLKQVYTVDMIDSTLSRNDKLVNDLASLSQRYSLFAVSNALSVSTELMLKKTGLLEFMQKTYGADQFKNPKPSPEPYVSTMESNGLEPETCMIFEDSEMGIKSARAASQVSGCHYAFVDRLDRLDKKFIQRHCELAGKTRVVVPAAGHGQRFQDAGYIEPKPLIPVNGRPMIEGVIENMSADKNRVFVFLVQRAHMDKFAIDACIEQACKRQNVDHEIVVVEEPTEGAACTVMLSRHWSDTPAPMFLANSDQYVSGLDPAGLLLSEVKSRNADCGILTFQDTHPKWSYVQRNKNGDVIGVVEKRPVSDEATVGIYWWDHGYTFVEGVRSMISKNLRVNGEFYVAPSFTEVVGAGKKVVTRAISKANFHGLGTPQDLESYLDQYLEGGK